jgi:hypothetical protein
LLLQIMVLALLFVTPFSYGEVQQRTEGILSFHSDIEVFPDAGMTVTDQKGDLPGFPDAV